MIILTRRKYTLTNHGKNRIKERSNVSDLKDIERLFADAVHHGKTWNSFEPPFSDFLKSKVHNSKVKVFKNMVFIYKGKTLITSYMVPEKYIRQVRVDNKKHQYHQSLSGVKNSELRSKLFRDLDMMVSLLIFNLSMEVPVEEELDRLDNLYARIIIGLKEFQLRMKVETVDSGDIINEDNILAYFRGTFKEFDELTSHLKSHMKSENKHVNYLKEFTRLSNNLVSCMLYLYNKKYFLYERSEGNEKTV